MEEPLIRSESGSSWSRIWVESKKIWRIAFPSILCRVSYYGLFVVTQAFIGHISKLDLAAYALIQVISIGFSNGILLGMSSATQTLCGQAFGAKKYHMLGLYLQKSCIINLVTATALVPFFVFAAPIYKLLGQEEAIANAAGKISLWFIPILFPGSLEMPMQMFLQAQRKNMVVGWTSVASIIIHLLLSWIFVVKFNLGVDGAMGALVVSFWLLVSGIFVYIIGGWCKDTWTGFSKAAFSDLWPLTKLSLSSGIMLCLELWYTAILVLLAGYMSDAATALSAFSICINIIGWVFRINIGFLGTTCVRVSNELGMRNAESVKYSIKVILSTSLSIGIVFWVLCLVFGHKIGYLFTNDQDVAEQVSSLSIFLAFSILLNSIQPVFSGVAIGAGWQSKAAWVNLGSYYAIGVPLGVLLAYLVHLKIRGIWIGMLFGVAVQTLVLGYLTWKTDWDDQVRKVSERLNRWSEEPTQELNNTADQESES
ncbi:unnamed protein product [Rhodiola kirilowii]